MFLKTIKRQGEKIIELDKKNKYLRERNKELNLKNIKLENIINSVRCIVENANEIKENYRISFEKIEKELDALKNVSSSKITNI